MTVLHALDSSVLTNTLQVSYSTSLITCLVLRPYERITELSRVRAGAVSTAQRFWSERVPQSTARRILRQGFLRRIYSFNTTIQLILSVAAMLSTTTVHRSTEAFRILHFNLACDWCKKRKDDAITLKKCGRCSIARYCSKECQSAAWPSHK